MPVMSTVMGCVSCGRAAIASITPCASRQVRPPPQPHPCAGPCCTDPLHRLTEGISSAQLCARLGHVGVAHDALVELPELRGHGEAAVEQEERRLHERAPLRAMTGSMRCADSEWWLKPLWHGRDALLSHLGHLLDGDAAVTQDAIPAVDVAYPRDAGDRVHVARVVEPQRVPIPARLDLRAQGAVWTIPRRRACRMKFPTNPISARKRRLRCERARGGSARSNSSRLRRRTCARSFPLMFPPSLTSSVYFFPVRSSVTISRPGPPPGAGRSVALVGWMQRLRLRNDAAAGSPRALLARFIARCSCAIAPRRAKTRPPRASRDPPSWTADRPKIPRRRALNAPALITAVFRGLIHAASSGRDLIG